MAWLRGEGGLTFGPGGAAGAKMQCTSIYVQPATPAGCQQLSKAAVRTAQANQGDGSDGVSPDEAALVIRTEGRLQRGEIPE